MKRLIAAAIVASALITVPVVLATGGSDGNTVFLPGKSVAGLTMGHTAKFTVIDDLYAHVGAPVALSGHSALTTGWKCNIKKSPATCQSSGGHFVPIKIPDGLPGANSNPVTVTCSASTQTVLLSTTPTYTDSPLSLPSGPTFSKCKDNITSKPDFTCVTSGPPCAALGLSPTTGLPVGCTSTGCNETIFTHGSWSSTFGDAADSGGENQGPNGDTVSIQGPNDSLSTVSAGSPMCLIDVNPATVSPLSGPYGASIGHDGAAVGDYNDTTGVDLLPAGGSEPNADTSFQVNQNPSLPSIPCPLIGNGTSVPPDQGHAAFTGSYTLKPVLGDS